MIKNNEYKKGDVVIISHKISDTGEWMQTVGILYKISKLKFVIGHNFKGNQPIDVSLIPRKSIQEITLISPKEINSIKDLK